MKAKQDAQHGEDGEILEYTKSTYTMMMPASKTILPREKPAPLTEAKTKWEKFREEKGLPPRKKRSRLVYDPIQKDWVPRWGKGSIKKLAEGDNWLMHEKPKHVESGMNPFDYARAEKKGKLEKQNLATLKNQLHKTKPGDMKKIQVLDQKQSGSMKLREDADRKDIRKREHKSLMKSLTMAQISTASMGKFDRKLKKEPTAPTSQTI